MRSIPLLLLLPASLFAQTKVLFIGNSYTYANDLPNTFRQVAQSLGETVTVASSAPGGYQLAQHAGYAPTLDAIAAEDWDFVVLQEQSQLGALPPEITTTASGAAQLAQAIEANYECTYPVFYMTWGRENGDAQNCPNFPFMCTYEGMQQGLRDNYVALAGSNDGYAAPVGWAWKTVRETHPEIDLYVADGSHPSPAGTYLAACVIYCTLFNSSAVGSTYLGGADQPTATILQTIASTTVLGATATWNMDVANGTDATSQGMSSDGPNVTFYHAGQGTHVWTCSDGQSSNEANPTFSFFTAGTYTMTHTYTDPCGNTDTVSWSIDIIPTGVDEMKSNGLLVRSPLPSLVEVRGVKGTVAMTIMDALGRVVASEQLQGPVDRMTCPPGFHIWRMVYGDGGMESGSLLVR